MEVYVENNITGKGLWIALPLAAGELADFLDRNHLTDEGEYQLTALSFRNLPPQECTGNLFLLNQKIQRFFRLSYKQQLKLVDFSFEEGISIETALFQYL